MHRLSKTINILQAPTVSPSVNEHLCTKSSPGTENAVLNKEKPLELVFQGWQQKHRC